MHPTLVRARRSTPHLLHTRNAAQSGRARSTTHTASEHAALFAMQGATPEARRIAELEEQVAGLRAQVSER